MLDLEIAIGKLEQINVMLNLMTNTTLTTDDTETAIDILQRVAESAIYEVNQAFYNMN